MHLAPSVDIRTSSKITLFQLLFPPNFLNENEKLQVRSEKGIKGIECDDLE
ncbi:hypothetical protein Lalb_Chr22g0360121 [Lupinus albus]|uniref:Uncharacterized protein n=1 Tax=Lupinus albus TaxID=3870 RepID=A0A6A4NDK4_LUPAL|nr:hypothetical protein Lalb_Chr22g0360121 [Lupinus albus]